MANQKSERMTLQWPPLLDLKNNNGSVDGSFKYYKKQNSPYINEMISPLYRKLGTNKAVYDKDGSEYTVEDNMLCKDGNPLFAVENEHFVKENVTEQYKDYLSFDIGAYLTFNDLDNTLTLKYNDTEFTSSKLYDEGSIVTSRVRVVNDSAIAVVYYTDGSNEYVIYLRLTDENSHFEFKEQAVWRRQNCRYSTSASYTPTTVTIKDADPIIFISYSPFTGYGISLISDYGTVINPVKSGFITFVEKLGVIFKYDGSQLIPSSTASSEVVTTTTNAYFYVSTANTKTNESGVCLRDPDGVTYYELNDDNTRGSEITFPVEYTPSSTGVTIEIDGVNYLKCNWARVNIVESMQVNCPDNPVAADWSFDVTFKDGTTTSQTVTSPYKKATYTRTRYVYGTSSAIQVGESDVTVNWNSESVNVPNSYWGKSGFLISHTETSTVSVSWLVAPNIFFDDGKMYSFWAFVQSTSSWSGNTLPAGSYIVEAANVSNVSVSGTVMTYTFSALNYTSVTSDYCCPRSIGYNINQGLFETTVKLNNTATPAPSTHASNSAMSASYHWLEYMSSNASGIKYFPGTSRFTAFNYYANAANIKDNADGTAGGGREDYAVYTVSGFRTQLNSHWNVLVNTSLGGTSLVNGISYSETPNSMGTLLVPWTSIDDDCYVVADDTQVIYRDAYNNWWRISIEEGVELSALLDDRYIIVNTTSFWNCYDSGYSRKFHYATDYNARGLFGTNVATYMSGDQYYSRLTANAINAAYNIQPRLAVTSLILPYVGRVRVSVSDKFEAIHSVCPEDADVQGIDVYYGATSGEEEAWPSCKYQYTVYPYNVQTSNKVFSLEGSTYSISTTTNALASPNIFTQIINNPGNRDSVKENNNYYTLVYIINNSLPIFAYSIASEALNVDAFFCIQGQFYAVIQDKIYSVVYSNGIISEQDAIVDIRGLQFVGSNPQIAFFWSESQRAFYSFTGDAILTRIYDASNLSYLLEKPHDFFYDESSQTIFCPTNAGLLCFGPKNHYLIPEYNKVSLVQTSVDGVTHITNDGITDNIVYYPKEGYDVMPIELETDWFGSTNETVNIIDRWQLVLYDISETNPKVSVKVGTRCLNDISATSEEKEFIINPKDWDKFTHSVLLNYNPKLIKGKAIRLFVESPVIIAEITAHISTNNAVNISRHSV